MCPLTATQVCPGLWTPYLSWLGREVVLSFLDLKIHTTNLTPHPNLTACTKIHSKWLKDLNTRAKTIKLLEEKHSCNSLGPWIRQWFLRFDTKNTSDQRGKMDKLHQNLKLLCFKEYYQENEDKPHNERKYLHIIFLIRV